VVRWRWRGTHAALLLLCALAGCAGATDSSRGNAAAPAAAGQLTATPGIVRAGICPPDDRGLPLRPDRLEKFQGELLRRLGFKLALRMQVSTLPSCTRASAVLSDRTVDLVATPPGPEATGRPETLQTEPYLVVQYALVVDTGSPAARAGLAGLGSGARVGVLAGTRGAAWATRRLGDWGARLVPFANDRAAAAAIAADRCDALLLPRASAIRTTRTVPGLRVDRLIDVGERATFLVAAGNPAFRSRVDRMLEEIIFDGSYAVIFDRHLAPTPVPIDFLPPD
jgi:ABC-type amino acid transport substrate-binding protein